MDLTVMICTWNNSKQLGITLDAISRCTIPSDLKWELVLVNNNSTDNTADVAREFTTKLPLVCIHEREQGLSRARNAGLKAASGRLIIFTDDDVKPVAGYIESYWSAYQERPSGFYFGGPIISEFEPGPPEEELLPLAPHSVRGLNWGPTPKLLAPSECFIGANWACPVEPLRKEGGFNVRIGLDSSARKVKVGEETDLMRRLGLNGLSPWYVPRAWLLHAVPARKCTLTHIAQRAQALAAAQVLFQRPEMERGPMVAGVPRWMYRRALALWLHWLKARALGKKGYREYVDLRSMLGTMQGIRDLQSTLSTEKSGLRTEL
ncbi:MAG: glycosyltransferase family 2 protein [Candidatus Binatia bacterium]